MCERWRPTRPRRAAAFFLSAELPPSVAGRNDTYAGGVARPPMALRRQNRKRRSRGVRQQSKRVMLPPTSPPMHLAGSRGGDWLGRLDNAGGAPSIGGDARVACRSAGASVVGASPAGNVQSCACRLRIDGKLEPPQESRVKASRRNVCPPSGVISERTPALNLPLMPSGLSSPTPARKQGNYAMQGDVRRVFAHA